MSDETFSGISQVLIIALITAALILGIRMRRSLREYHEARKRIDEQTEARLRRVEEVIFSDDPGDRPRGKLGLHSRRSM
jgi:hypothetical protein